MGRDAVREKVATPSKEADLYSWAVRPPFDFSEIMERRVVWPGDEA